MTREDAILCLKGIKNYGRDTFTEQSDWQESLDMAIEALEQKPTTFDNSALENLKAEILQLKTKTSFTFVNIDDVLRLIDKHMESKENENG